MAREWSDDRLDALNHKVDVGFKRIEERFVQVDRRFGEVERRLDEVDRRLDRVESEVHDLRSEIKDEFKAMRTEMKTGLERVNDRIDSIQRGIFFGAISLTGGILAGFAGIFVLLAAKL